VHQTNTKDTSNHCAVLIKITGLVQGVGFRPFVFKLAQQNNIHGWVKNQNDGVLIKAEGSKEILNNFISLLNKNKPIAAHIENIDTSETQVENFSEFNILKSINHSDEITQISPDIAVCLECLDDMKHQKNRINYPFINCTNCGPRFSIIHDLPYDRKLTTMQPFEMCDECKKEYEDVNDRRFHAQPVACNACGPEYELTYQNKKETDINKILQIFSSLITEGKIIAVKGIGGFHLACDALNANAVKRLRTLKNRDSKPFAVMFKDIETIQNFALMNEKESEWLQSWRRPIVLLRLKNADALPNAISNKLETVGAMLPYTPFHYLMFEHLNTAAIVLTSGNISDDPIVIDNAEAHEKLSIISDALLTYNRDINNRTDDSVLMIANNKPRIIRRSRGFVPTPIYLNLNVEGIMAVGGELKNTFCIGKQNMAILSQHIGDLKNIETFDFYKESIHLFEKIFRIKPEVIAGDMHPDYLSSKYLQSINVKKNFVQHHHAHIASCMAEHGLDEKVIGVSFDGTGFGDDGNTWGSEFFICDLAEYKRFTHFEYLPMPGGDKVSEEPWRMAVAYLFHYFGNVFLNWNLSFLKNIPEQKINLLIQAIKNNINCPLTSGAGRLFDAVSALLNICTIAGFEAEGPMRMESMINQNCNEKYLFEFNQTISFKKTFEEILNDLKNNISLDIISAKLHNTVVAVIANVANQMRNKYNINKIVLSGGVFQNKYLLEKTENILTAENFEVFTHSKIPSNDGGISLGQLAVAAKRRQIESNKVYKVRKLKE